MIDYQLGDARRRSSYPEMATNVPGIFAAGDCTGKPWQIAKAAGEGQVAALSAVDFLAGNK